MSDYSPLYTGGAEPFTATTSADVIGGRVLVVSGDGTVAHAQASTAAAVVGVAAHDAAAGARVTVWPLHGPVHELSAPGAIAAGAGVVATGATAEGQVATSDIGDAAAAGTLIGIASSTAADDLVRVVCRG